MRYSGLRLTHAGFVVLLMILVNSALAEPSRDPYLGQSLPDSIPAVFASGVISAADYRLHGVPAVSPDGNEIFWPVIPPALMHTVRTDSGWSTPNEFALDLRGVGSPVFSGDGQRLYVQGAGATGYGSLDIWFIERQTDGWSTPQNLGSPPNTKSMESQPSLTSNGDLYFTGKRDSVGMNRGIYVSRFVNGRYGDAQLLNGRINTAAIEYTPFVTADGSYLLFASSRPSVDESDLRLYVSFADDRGEWDEPIDLSETLGLTTAARFPAISPDGRALFYLADGNVYWVSTNVIERLRPTR
jgi:hypothetical protein